MRIVHPEKLKGKKIVVVVGGGFAGLNAAKVLADKPEVTVVLVDKRNHHLFQPLLYQVATAGLNPSDIAVPIRSQFSANKNIETHMGKIGRVNLLEKTISDPDDEFGQSELQLEYDYLILACGSSHSYFGRSDWEKFAPGLKTLEQATEIRRRILSVFEKAENELDPMVRTELLSFVVVGGGPTGVELAGAIAEISKQVLAHDFKQINPKETKIILIEAGPRLLAQFSEDLSVIAAQNLYDLGVDVRVSTRVEDITSFGVRTQSAFINSKCVLWCAGVRAAKIEFDANLDRDRSGRIKVCPDLSIPGFPEAFVVGDMAFVEFGHGQILPGLAPAAIQSGTYAAEKILASIRNQKKENFKYIDKGQMATIGKHFAVVQKGNIKISGMLAWLAWLFIHLLYLVGFKNRASVFFQWIWSYLFSKRGARLITEKDWRLKDYVPLFC